MDFGRKIDGLREEMLVLEKRIGALENDLAEARTFTAELLACCQKHGIETVAVNVKSDLIKSTQHWPFRYEGNVFADEMDADGWPAIWGVPEELGIDAGRGNGGQRQIGGLKAQMLIDGVYKLGDGCWRRLEDER